MDQRAQFFARAAGVVAIVVGCYAVLNPFVPAVLFAAVACNASWRLNLRLRGALGNRPSLAALLMTLLLALLAIGPSSLLASNLANNLGALTNELHTWMDRGLPPAPAWLESVPIFGSAIDEQWRRLSHSREEFMALVEQLLEPLRGMGPGAVKALGAGVLQLALAAFVSFFFYRDGESIVGAIRSILERVAGAVGDEVLDTVDSTVGGVVLGVFGTALGQSCAAMIGLAIAGVPMVLLLSAATFFLSILPIGPPIVWVGAAIWLARQDEIGWAVFMLLWGLFVISSIDNFLKPWLISRRSSLPMLLVVFGVFGGIATFGFIGVFIGPPILAVGLTLVHLWTQRPGAPNDA